MKKEKKYNVMIGSGEHAIFIKVPKGTKVFINGGNRIEAGLTIEEVKKRLDAKLDDTFFPKPGKFTKKLIKKFKK